MNLLQAEPLGRAGGVRAPQCWVGGLGGRVAESGFVFAFSSLVWCLEHRHFFEGLVVPFLKNKTKKSFAKCKLLLQKMCIFLMLHK